MLVTYLVTHLSNHALGVISVEAAETGRAWFVLLWRNPVATLALYMSFGFDILPAGLCVLARSL